MQIAQSTTKIQILIIQLST